MTDRLRTIRLYGKLGATYGRVHRLAVSSAREAIRALCVLLPGFEAELMAAHEKGVVYAVFNGRQNLSCAELANPPGRDDIRIAPMLQGSKQAGALQTIVGAVLVVVGMVVNYFFPGAGTPFMQFGFAMMAGGVIQMLVPQKSGVSSQDSVDNQASYNFNGPVNTSAQSNPVPLGYGRCVGGSAVISGGIYAEDQA
ncbi:putative phage tail protein [Herbaspirillum seropedicae]|uniref:tail assembly protein n=1 Tax=Herbaspirillum seropedicae TaxID=964 RepID=UPI00339090C9